MRLGDVHVRGSGSWFPPPVPAGEAVLAGSADATAVAKMDATAVVVADTDDVPPEMAARAGALALRRAGDTEIGLLLHASVEYQGHKLWAPASYVQRRTGVTGCPAIEVRQASNGGMAAIDLAVARLKAFPGHGDVLLTAADRWPLPAVDRWRTDDGTVYADGAGALVLSAGHGFARILSTASVSEPALEGMHRAGAGFGTAAMSYAEPLDLNAAKKEYIAEAGLSHTVSLVNGGQRAAMKTALADADAEIGDIDWFVLPHFGKRRIEQIYTGRFGIPLERTTWSWSRGIGHLGAADQFAGLTHLIESGRLVAGQRCLLAGVGSGFTWSCAVLQMLETPAWA